MALDRAPWFVSTPGVHHTSEVARVLAYAATGGARGVIGSGSLKVSAQSTPNGTVRVAAGVGVAPSTYSGHEGQSYIMRAHSTTNVTIEPTGSSGGRTDLLVLRVDDIGLVGQPPADPNDYDYAKLHVIQGGDPNQPFPYVPLARIVIPSGDTGTITGAMIHDAREVVLGREATASRTYGQLSSDTLQYLTSQVAYPQGEYFPRIGGTTGSGALHSVSVPEWATEMEIRAEWLSVANMANSGNGHMWVGWDTVVQNRPAYYTQAYRWTSADTSSRQNWVVADTVRVDPAIRGKEVFFSLRANRDSGNSGGEIRMDTPSGLVLNIRFMEKAD